MSLVKPQIAQRSSIESLPKALRSSIKRIATDGAPEPAQNQPPLKYASRNRCTICPRKKDVKTRYSCDKCEKAMCPSHMKSVKFNVTDKNDKKIKYYLNIFKHIHYTDLF